MNVEGSPPPLPDLEREVMEEVWERGELTGREALDALNARAERPRAYTTVLTVLIRLERKGLLRRRRRGRADVYGPVLSRSDYVRARAEVEVGSILDTYGELALAHFARHVQGLDPERRERLRKLADDE
jgi:predicted transcriptional regulator